MIVWCIDAQCAASAAPSLLLPDPPSWYWGVIEALLSDQKWDHGILFRHQHCCRCLCLCFRLSFHHHLCRHLCLSISSLRCMFRCSRCQSWIVKLLMSLCHKMLFYFRKPMIFQYFGILQYHWSILPRCHNLMYAP